MAGQPSPEACKQALKTLCQNTQLFAHCSDSLTLLESFTRALEDEKKSKKRHQDLMNDRRQTEDFSGVQHDELEYAARLKGLLKFTADVRAAKAEHGKHATQAQTTARDFVNMVRSCLLLAKADVPSDIWSYIIDQGEDDSGSETCAGIMITTVSPSMANAPPLEAGEASHEPISVTLSNDTGILTARTSQEHNNPTVEVSQKPAPDASVERDLVLGDSDEPNQEVMDTCPESPQSGQTGDSDGLHPGFVELGREPSVFEVSDGYSEDKESDSDSDFSFTPKAKARRAVRSKRTRAARFFPRDRRIAVKTSLDQGKRHIDAAQHPTVVTPDYPRWAVVSEEMANICSRRPIKSNQAGEYMHTIVPYAEKYYILRCDVCQAHMGINSLAEMRRHVCQCWSAEYWGEPHMDEHRSLYAMKGHRFNGNLTEDENLIQIFGVEVLGCSHDKMIRNNRAFKAKVRSRQKNLDGGYTIMSGPYAREPRRKPAGNDFGLKEPFDNRQDCIRYMENLSRTRSKRSTPHEASQSPVLIAEGVPSQVVQTLGHNATDRTGTSERIEEEQVTPRDRDAQASSETHNATQTPLFVPAHLRHRTVQGETLLSEGPIQPRVNNTENSVFPKSSTSSHSAENANRDSASSPLLSKAAQETALGRPEVQEQSSRAQSLVGDADTSFHGAKRASEHVEEPQPKRVAVSRSMSLNDSGVASPPDSTETGSAQNRVLMMFQQLLDEA